MPGPPPSKGVHTHWPPGISHESHIAPPPQHVGCGGTNPGSVTTQTSELMRQSTTHWLPWQIQLVGQPATQVPVPVSQVRHCPDSAQLWQTWSDPQTRQVPPQSESAQQPPG